jgi:predicted ATP-binding protein involved in virulence
MEEVFISSISINKVRHLANLEIPLSNTERKHLILTGKNGSGKTSVLTALKELFVELEKPNSWTKKYAERIQKYAIVLQSIKNDKLIFDNKQLEKEFSSMKITDFIENTNITCDFNNLFRFARYCDQSNFLFVFFEANRLVKFEQPDGPSKIEIKPVYNVGEKANKLFLQHLVNLRFSYLDAIVNKEHEAAQEIDEWMNKLELSLKNIFDDKNLKIHFDSKNFKYTIKSGNKEDFDFTTLSDGFSRAFDIITELMMRMEKKHSKVYDAQGIVLIDEIETHLHIDLQKKILPFLTSFFPKIQFIVTTHSPFVLTSLKDAIVYDLERQEPLEDLSGFSVDAIIEGYFDSDKYSEIIKKKVADYEQLMLKPELNIVEEKQLQSFKQYFGSLTNVFAEELQLKIQQIRLLNPAR